MIRSAARAARRGVKWSLGALIVLGCLLWGSPSYAAVTPAPYPSSGGSASSWSCAGTESADVPPVPGSDCVVTSWGVDPVPDPFPTPAPVTVEGGALSSDQWEVLSFALGLLVFLGAAHTVGSWRS